MYGLAPAVNGSGAAPLTQVDAVAKLIPRFDEVAKLLVPNMESELEIVSPDTTLELI